MKSPRKAKEESAGTRTAILDAAEALMISEGYPAVTSRRVAEAAGLKSQLVYYYFRTMDDLFIAIYERSEKDFLQQHLLAVNAKNPVRALWDLSIHPKRTRLAHEFIALSNRKEAVRKITARMLEQTHTINVAFISKYLQDSNISLEEYPPVVISRLISGMSRALINEASLGFAEGHTDVIRFAERWLDRLDAAIVEQAAKLAEPHEH
jgi:AcrR family transcriptional regulator